MNPKELIEFSKGGLNIQWGEVLDDYITTLVFHPGLGDTSASLIVGTGAGTLYRLSAASGETVWKCGHHNQGVLAIAPHPNLPILACSAEDGQTLLLELDSGRVVKQLWVAHRGWCDVLAWSPSGRLLAAAVGKNLRLWDATGESLSGPGPFPNTLSGLAWWNDQEVLASTYGKVSAWKVDSSDFGDCYEWPTSLIRMKVHLGKGLIAVSTQEATVEFWRRDRGSIGHMTGYYGKVTSLDFSTCGRWLATNGGPAVTCWDFSGRGPEGKTPAMLELHLDHVSALAFSPGTKVRLASAGEDGLVGVWEQHEEKFSLLGCQPLGSQVDCLAWATSGSVLFVGGGEGQVAAVAVESATVPDKFSSFLGGLSRLLHLGRRTRA